MNQELGMRNAEFRLLQKRYGKGRFGIAEAGDFDRAGCVLCEMAAVEIVYAYGDEPYRYETREVFSNRSGLALDEIRRRFRARMINASYFVPWKVGLPELRSTACDATSTTDWHELIHIAETTLEPTAAADISEIAGPA